MNKVQLNKIDFICLYTSDIVASAQFYRDILGFQPTNPKEDPATSNYYAFNMEEITFALERNGVKKDEKKIKTENPYLLQFKLESKEQLEEMNKWLEGNGVRLYDRTKQTDYGLITNFCDPDGNKLEIIFQD